LIVAFNPHICWISFRETQNPLLRVYASGRTSVGETEAFLLLTLATTLLATAIIVATRSVARAQSMARAFYAIAIVLSVAALLLIMAGASGVVAENALYARLLRPLLFRGWIVIGVGISSALLLALNSLSAHGRLSSEAVRSFITSPYVLKGLCFSVSLSFFCTEVGKLAHDAEMRQFFLQSGYAIWFMYFIMMAETAGAIGLLISRTAVPAAIGLMVIMVGAIRTHAHNRDQFSDSVEALHLLILLGCILLIRPLRTKNGSALVIKQHSSRSMASGQGSRDE
jgi:uncharacterized membrane protein YphA (DoxX/SURF4 family)